MFLADTAVHEILNSYARAGGSFQVGLTTTTPSEDPATLGTLVEPTATSYARVTLARSSAGWGDPTDRRIETIVDLTFPDPAGTDWGVIQGWVLYESGTPVVASRLAEAVDVTGDTTNVILPAGSVFLFAPATLY